MASSDDKTGPDGPDAPEPAGLRTLRLLVTTLTAVMIAAAIAIVVLLWLGYTNTRAPLPDQITLPDGAVATSFTQGPDWYAVVTASDEILIFDRATGRLRQTLQITPAAE